jgi:uncharacterized membrane protein HdeD (DUF308 family)/alpha-beta hydrolase superfamily lysophospholipase
MRLRRFYGDRLDRLPWWAAAVLGLVSVAVGFGITLKPFSSLGVLVAMVSIAFVIVGIGELSSARGSLERWGGVAWIAAGVAVAVWSGLTVHGLAIFAGVSLLVGGVLRMLGAVGGDVEERWISLLSGLARAIFGVLALSWPDVTVLVLALLVGPAMILFGIGQVGAALRFRDRREERGRRRWPRAVRFVGVVGSLVVALGLLLISSLVHRGTSTPDAFYAPPRDVPGRPGVLLRSDSFSTGIPGDAKAWRILYTTTTADGHPAVASGVVVVAKDAPSSPRPVIAWAHGTTGFASKCAPSLVGRGLEAGALPALDQVMTNKWVLVATDYVGLGTKGPHPYLIGDPEARSVLDSIRAARQLPGLNLQKRTIVWGHSQGGGAALWTGILEPSYAPDDDVIGVAALSPASELPAIFAAIKDTPVGKIMGPYVLAAYSAFYPGVRFNDYVRPAAQVIAHATANRCLSGPEALVSIATNVGKEPIFSRDPDAGALGKALNDNIPLHPIKAPLFIGQGLADTLVLPSAQKTYVDALCNAGQELEYHTYKGYDHVGVVLDPKSPLISDLIQWTKDRFDGRPRSPGCVMTNR